jgi:hypothetical protein
MNKYDCFECDENDYRIAATYARVEAASSLEARRQYAEARGIEVRNVIAIRID